MLKGGGVCYSNVTSLATGNFGEWKTEQKGVGAACNDASSNYFLAIYINNESQGERRRLNNWDFLRKNADETTTGLLTLDKITLVKSLIGSNKTTFFGNVEIFTDVNDSRLSQSILIHNTLPGELTTSNIRLQNDLNRTLSLGLSSSGFNSTKGVGGGANRGALSYGGGANFYFSSFGDPSSWIWRNLYFINQTVSNITEIMELTPSGNLSITGNFTAQSGFFSYLGNSVSRITTLFVQDIDASGNINASNYTLNGTTITDWNDISSGNSVTASGAYLYQDSSSIYVNETKLNNTIDARATSQNLTNYALKNQSETFAGNITLQGQILTDSGCLVPHANFWAEESGGISSGGGPAGLEYGFGDGSTDSYGPRQPCSGRIVYLTIQATKAANGDGRVDIVVNGNSISLCNLATPSTDSGSTGTACNLQFNSGDRLTPRTTTSPTGTNNGYIVSWWVVYD